MRIINVLFIISVFLFSNTGKAMESKFNLSPKDTTTKLKNRAAALLMLEEGKELYLEGKYRQALLKFKEATNKDQNNPLCAYNVGLSHLRLNNYGYALQYGKESESMFKEKNVDVAELLATSYHRLGILDSAEMYYDFALQNLSKQRLKDLRIKERIEEVKLAKSFQDSGKVNLRKNFSDEINSGYNEYGLQLIENGKVLYFTSRRDNTTGGQNNPDDEQYFEDNYRAVWNGEDKIWDSITNQLDRVNSPGFDCISYLSPDGLKGLMTLNTTASNLKSTTMSSDICEISLTTKGKWASPKVIKNKSINTSFFDGSATITADGNTMYFVSDRKGDKSMTDIYIVQKEGSRWGEAKPVSDSINTTMRETTPWISPDGQFLFFSSDGHKGMGGYDIYVSENLGKTWSKPVNLGPEVNSTNDDTHFILYKEFKKAIFSSLAADKLKSSIDIFEIDLENYQLPIKF